MGCCIIRLLIYHRYDSFAQSSLCVCACACVTEERISFINAVAIYWFPDQSQIGQETLHISSFRKLTLIICLNLILELSQTKMDRMQCIRQNCDFFSSTCLTSTTKQNKTKEVKYKIHRQCLNKCFV